MNIEGETESLVHHFELIPSSLNAKLKARVLSPTHVSLLPSITLRGIS